MPNLKEVRNRIQSVKSTQQITKAMKMVAASKLRRAQDSIMQMRPYAKKLHEILSNVTASLEGEVVNSLYTEDRIPTNVLIVVLTSDRGLAGAFNSNAIKAALRRIEQEYAEQNENGRVTVMPLGKKAYDFFRKRDFKVADQFYHILHDTSFDQVREAAEFVMKGFEEEKFDRVDIIYNEFKNVATQLLQVEQFLPLMAARSDDAAEVANVPNYIFEPSLDVILEKLIPQTLKIQFYKAVLESAASEHGARMTAMDQATDNAGEMLKDLKLVYNRTRQAAITKEILEIVSGANALEAG
jgi:F-type H+-transporting ATPase subunit gamma